MTHVLTALVASLLVHALTAATVHANALPAAAAALAPGSWVEVTTSNLETALAQSGSSGGILPWADSGVWDPGSRQFFFCGGDHNWSISTLRCIAYSAEANAWRILPQPAWAAAGTTHGYDHNAVDPARGEIYFRDYYAGLRWQKLSVASGTWTA